MSQERREQLRRFEQKMREQGADGFADGPRPWEHWDESGHQANNRIWEGSARRIYPGSRKARSLGHRLLSVLAFIALTTLLVGIGGVYFSHTHTQQLAETGVEPLPFTDQRQPAATVADNAALIDRTATQTEELNVLSAPAAGTGATQEQQETAVAIAAVDSDSSPDRDESAPHTAMVMPPLTTADTIPPETQDSINSVSIETIVTEQSVTTTVYTRHPRQDEAEIVAAIETTPPPFAHAIDSATQDMPAPATASAGSDAADAPSAPEAQRGAETDHQPVEQSADATTVAGTETGSESTDTGLLAAATAEAADEQPDAVPDSPPAEETEVITTVAVAGMDSKTATTESSSAVEAEIDTAVSDDQNDALPDDPPAEQGEAASIDLAAADTDRATTARQSPAEAAAEVTAAAEVETVTPLAPVAKTGGWVINLSSYTRESTANRKLVLFQQQGVDAEVFAVTINDKPMYRIRLAGFTSRRAAQSEVKSLEQALGLEGAWVSER
jgi:SPOR domain